VTADGDDGVKADRAGRQRPVIVLLRAAITIAP
jgi:hypothetical protein